MRGLIFPLLFFFPNRKLVLLVAKNVAPVLQLVWCRINATGVIRRRFTPQHAQKTNLGFFCLAHQNRVCSSGWALEAERLPPWLDDKRNTKTASMFVATSRETRNQNRSRRQRLDSDVPFTVAACVVLSRYSVELWGWSTQTKQNKIKSIQNKWRKHIYVWNTHLEAWFID